MKKNIFQVILVMFCLSCSSPQMKEQKFAEVENCVLKKEITSLTIDTILLDSMESSYIGLLHLYEDSLYFVDKKFNWIFTFDKEGHLGRRLLGQGKGPKELPTSSIEGYARTSSSGYFFVGVSLDCHIYEKDLSDGRHFIINKGIKQNSAGNDYDLPWIYTLCYPNLQLKTYGDYLYYTVYSEYPGMNFMEDSDNYFKSSHILSKLNLTNGKVEAMLGGYPEIYQKNDGLRQFSFVNFDIDEHGNFYISYEGDSLIYQYDKDFTPTYAYGYAGSDMTHKQREFSSLREFRKGYAKSRIENGYYTALKYVDTTGLLFRSYKKGKSKVTDGLQIYRNRCLVGDVSVPKNFEVLGYISPYYYAFTGVDEEHECVKLYKFKF